MCLTPIFCAWKVCILLVVIVSRVNSRFNVVQEFCPLVNKKSCTCAHTNSIKYLKSKKNIPPHPTSRQNFCGLARSLICNQSRTRTIVLIYQFFFRQTQDSFIHYNFCELVKKIVILIFKNKFILLFYYFGQLTFCFKAETTVH